jgi:arylsulfatase A-like enzyme
MDPSWERTMMVVCSDHGHETVLGPIRIDDLLVEAGLKDGPDSRDVVVAPNGTAALIYLAPEANGRRGELVRFLERQEWLEGIYAGAALEKVGHPGDTALAIALDMGKTEAANPYGVPGCGYVAFDTIGNKDYTGLGQHGGLGANEQRPFMFARGGGLPLGVRVEAPTSPIDIAPTLLDHLGVPGDGMEGSPLAAG